MATERSRAGINQISGQISGIAVGTEVSLITIDADGQQLVSAMPNVAAQDLDLKANDSVLALVKSTETMLIKGEPEGVEISARNKLSGQVSDIQQIEGAMAAVTIDVGGWNLTSVLSRHALEKLQIALGEPVTALFKATDLAVLKEPLPTW